MSRTGTAAKLKRAASLIGGYHATRLWTRRLPRVLMYHRFSAAVQHRRTCAELFEQQLRAVAAKFTVMSMGELVHRFRADGKLPVNAAVITVDDGHSDFYELAFPVLKKLGLPATLYVTTRFVEGEIWLWPDRLEHSLFSSTRTSIDVSELGRLPLGNEHARWQAWKDLVSVCVRRSDEERRALVEEVARASGSQQSDEPTSAFRAINWQQAREMAEHGIEIGAHTRNHPILSKLPACALEPEIAGAKLDIEVRLQRSVRSFCYPNGTPDDFNSRVKSQVVAAGFDSAVAAYFDIDDWSDLYAIKRIPASSNSVDFCNKLYGMDQVALELKRLKARS